MSKEGGDYYEVLGLDKECTPTELKNAYKKLAMRWHPDRCSGNSEEAKSKFQAIQHAYSVLSDANKRFMYDVGVYDNDDDENGMGDFLNEMAAMMNQTQPNENAGEESFEQLQELFNEMFQGDHNDSFGSATNFCSNSSSYNPYGEFSNQNGKCNNYNSQMNSGKSNVEGVSGFNADFKNFCAGVERDHDHRKGKAVVVEEDGRERADGSSKRRGGRKQKVSSGHDVTNNDVGIFAS